MLPPDTSSPSLEHEAAKDTQTIIAGSFPHYGEGGRELIVQAYDFAALALKDITRENGTPFIDHPMKVALIVSDEIGLQAECVAAVFLHEAMRMNPEVKQLPSSFPQEVIKMVEGLNHISTIKPRDTRLEAENYKKLIVQYSTDPRVTVLKIADRLEVMRSLELFPKASRERKIMETLMLYIPLAHQLGLYNIKSEMEDIYFRFSDPEQYRSITNKLKATARDREKLTSEFIEPLKKTLSEAGINYKLKIRTKTAYSIFKKMKKQKVPFEGVFDVFAIRFIVDCPPDPVIEKDLCWKVFAYVTEEYEQDSNRLRDWLTNPKPNGYESLHITVKNKEGAYIEVQIRSKRMDDEAENGHAAHWSYKGIQHEASLDKWLLSVRSTLEHPSEKSSPDDLPQPPDKEIFIFTPSGELRILPKGASILDFAFNIHTNLGLHCTGGKINGKAVSFKEKLRTGDVVEIFSGKNQKPSADWVNYVVSSKARGKIRQAIHEEEFRSAAEGKEILLRRLKNWKLDFPDEMLAEFMKKNRYPSLKEFYSAIGEGTLDVNVIKSYILEHDAMMEQAAEAARLKEEEKKRQHAQNEESGKGDDILIIGTKGLKGLDYKMAKCCNPVYGDDVFGFVTRDAGIKIHRISCPNASRLMDQYPYRIQAIKWAPTQSSGSFQASLRVIADMEPFVINQIMELVAQFRASIRSFSFTENDRNGTYDITMKLSVPSNTELDKVTSLLRNMKHIQKVSRL